MPGRRSVLLLILNKIMDQYTTKLSYSNELKLKSIYINPHKEGLRWSCEVKLAAI